MNKIKTIQKKIHNLCKILLLKDEKKKIKTLFERGFFHILTGNTLTNAIAFISSIVVVRLINKTNYAYLSYANNLYSYITVFAGFGLALALLKFCSSRISPAHDKAYLKFALINGSIIQLLLSVLLIIYVAVANIPFPEARSLVFVMFFIPLFTYILQVLQNYARAHENHKIFAKTGIFYSFFTLVFSIIFAIAFGVMGVPIARYIATILAIFFAVRFVIQKVKDIKAVKLNKKLVKAFYAMGISLAIGTFFATIMPMNELFLVNNVIRDAIVTANYKVAILIPSQLGIISSSIMIYFFPIVAKMNNNKDIWKISKKIQIMTMAIIAVVTIIGIIITPYIITYVYGPSYKDSLALMSIFWVVYFFNAGFRIVPLNILPALGRVKFIMIVSIAACAIHLLLDYIFIKSYGINGVATATVIVNIGSGLACWIYLKLICKKDKCANIIPNHEEEAAEEINEEKNVSNI